MSKCSSRTIFVACVGAVTVLLLGERWAWAQGRPAAEARLPGLEGATGLLQIPSAYVQRSGEATLLAGGARRAFGGALVGVAQRFEIGTASGYGQSGQPFVTAKVNLVPETLLAPTFAAGVRDAFGTTPEGRTAYVVVSKSITPYFVEAVSGQRHLAIKLHAGYGDGLYRQRLFVGGEVWGQSGFGVLGEVCAGHLNLGARYARGSVGMTVGTLDLRRVGAVLSLAVPLR